MDITAPEAPIFTTDDIMAGNIPPENTSGDCVILFDDNGYYMGGVLDKNWSTLAAGSS
jgi:hypothetical protein